MCCNFIEFIEIVFSTLFINSMMHEHLIRSAMLICLVVFYHNVQWRSQNAE